MIFKGISAALIAVRKQCQNQEAGHDFRGTAAQICHNRVLVSHICMSNINSELIGFVEGQGLNNNVGEVSNNVFT